MQYLSKKLRQIMDSRNLNQKDLAKMANVGQTTISKWLNSNYSPKVKNLEPLAKALGLTVGDLIGDFGNNQELTEEDKRFISLTPQQKTLLLKYLDFLENEKIIELMLKYKLE